MTLTAKALSTGFRRLRSDPSAHELLARAEQLAPELIGRQPETEARAQYSRAVHEQFSAAGLLQDPGPRRYGGYQLGSDAFFGVSMVLAQGCPSTAWMFSRGAIHALTAASLFSERAQDEIFAAGEFIAPATLVPGGTAERAADGGWLLNGIWANCSGAAYASHFIGHLMVEPPMGGPQLPMMFIAPRAEWRSVDDGDPQLGLRGGGSDSVAIVNGRIPGYFALLGTQLSECTQRGDAGPGAARRPGVQRFGLQLPGVGARLAGGRYRQGCAGCLRGTGPLAQDLVPPIADRYLDSDYQYWFGEAIGLVATAEAALPMRSGSGGPVRDGAATGSADRTAAGGGLPTGDPVVLAGRRALPVPDRGHQRARPGDRLERLWRDISMLHGQSGSALAMSTIASRDLARSRLGLC